MRRVVVCTNLSLDGVMQAPARADEDPRDGFQHGGWATPYAAMAEAGQVFANADALLFGRRTYEDFYGIHPLVLGSGTRLFGEASKLAKMSLVGSRTTPNGVVIATYRPDTAG